MKALVVGASGGIGSGLLAAMLASPGVEQIHATRHRTAGTVEHRKLTWHSLDATDEDAVAALAGELGTLDRLINCVGLLHDRKHGPEKTVRALDPAFFLDNMRINALPSLLLAKHFAPHLKHGGPSVFATVSAKVGSIEDNRLGGWYSYRASKAALNMALKTLALEWRLRVPKCCVAALHPGTTDTALSRPFQGNVPPEKLFAPDRTAKQLIRVMDSLTPEQSGRFWSWDGRELPW